MKNAKRYFSDYLLPTQDLRIGIGSVFNLFGNYFEYHSSETEEQADCKAIEQDFRMVGQDIADVLHGLTAES